jgi:hypothetical protein
MGSEDLSVGGCQATPTHVIRDLETIDAELQLVAAFRRQARQRGGPLPSIDAADAVLDELRELTGLPRLTSCLGSY